jgi:hypothetical protein
MQNYRDTVLSQYANSPSLGLLIQSFNDCVDPQSKINAFYSLMWNVDTAQGYGLDVWGRIVGIGRVLNVSTGKFFGFDEATTVSADPFGQSPFYAGQVATSNYALSDTSYRLLILAKAAANISNCSIPSINRILRLLFSGRGNCYVSDGLNMTMTYDFYFTLSAVEIAIVQGTGVLPKPAGVTATVVQH